MTLGAALPLLGVSLVLPSGVSQGAVTANGITGVTRSISAGPAVAFPRANPGTVGAPASPEINPAGPAEGDPADGAANGAATAQKLAQARGGFTFNRRVPGEARTGRATRGQGAVIVRTGPQLRASFHALDHFDSRTADNGNEFSNEPPDQGLCVGSGKVFESVNTAVQVFDKDGTGHGVTSLNRFYGLPSAFVRPAGRFGPDVFDPSCVFDPQTKTFFQVADDLGVDPATGALTGQALLDIAVTKNPLGTWRVYQLDVTDDGSNGTPVHADCPCFGDYPHIGFDNNGFYIDTNEFPIFNPGFDGAQVCAFDKSELASGAATIHVTQFDTTGADQGNGGFTVWPAQSPSAGDFSKSNGGTQSFLSSNAVFTDAGVSDNIVVWSLTGTNSLGRNNPNAVLHDARVPVTTYSVPPPVVQKPGPAPLLECLNNLVCRPLVADPGPDEVLQTLDSNDSRMQQVVYTGGQLYSSLDNVRRLRHFQRAKPGQAAMGRLRRRVGRRLRHLGRLEVHRPDLHLGRVRDRAVRHLRQHPHRGRQLGKPASASSSRSRNRVPPRHRGGAAPGVRRDSSVRDRHDHSPSSAPDRRGRLRQVAELSALLIVPGTEGTS